MPRLAVTSRRQLQAAEPRRRKGGIDGLLQTGNFDTLSKQTTFERSNSVAA
jgi:hypothetical protein